MRRPDAAGIRERYGGPFEIVDSECAVAPAADKVLVGGQKVTESHELGGFDRGDNEGARPVGAMRVDRDAEVHMFGMVHCRLAVHQRIRIVHLGHLHERLNRGKSDKMRETDLASPRGAQPFIDDTAVVEHGFGWNFTERRRRRNSQRSVHVGGHGLRCSFHANGFAGRKGSVARHKLVPFRVRSESWLCRGAGSRRKIRARGN